MREMNTSTTCKLLPAGSAPNVVRDATRAYNDLVDRDHRALPATADEWFSVSRQLAEAAKLLTGEREYFVSSRARDADQCGRQILICQHVAPRQAEQTFDI